MTRLGASGGASAVLVAALRAAVLCAAVACACATVTPRDAGATVFSRDGWGWWWDEADAAARARGGTSVAVTGYGATGETNPATVATTDLSYGFGAYSGEVASIKGNADSGSFRRRSDLLPHIGGVIVLPRGVRAFGLLRIETDASFDRKQRFESSVSGGYDLETKGNGGWNRLEIGLTDSALRRRLLFGAGVSRIMGTAREAWTYRFTDSTSAVVRDELEARLGGAWMGTAGAVFRPDTRFEIGASGTIAGSSAVTQTIRGIEGGSFQSSTVGRQEMPAQWAAGVHGRPVPRIGVSADVVRTLWGSARLKAETGGPETQPFIDTTRWGVGIEYEADVSENGPAPRLPRWVARAGFAHTPYYVAASDGSQVEENAVTLGMSARTARGRAGLNFGLEVGKRGDRARVGVEETFYRIDIGVSFSSVIREY